MAEEGVHGEVLQRVRRIETRLMRLCIYLGLDPTDRERCKIVEGNTIEVEGYDVSIGDCLRYASKSGLRGTFIVKCRDVHLGTLVAEPPKVSSPA
jgi:hypothetical protein